MVSHDTRDPEAGKTEGSPAMSDDRASSTERKNRHDRKTFAVGVVGSALGRLLADVVQGAVKRASEAIDGIF